MITHDTRAKCKICKARLSIYNTSGECFKHSAKDDAMNEAGYKFFTSRPQPLLHEERGGGND